MPFFVIFLMIPFVEIMVFIAVGEHIGLFTTLALAFMTAIIGGVIIRYQGFQTFSSLQNNMNRGEMPVQEIFDGFCLIAAGATLITPGFVTDTIGFLLLIPGVRRSLRTVLSKYFTFGSSKEFGFSSAYRPYNHSDNDPDILDGEYKDVSCDTENNDNQYKRIDKS